MHNVEIPNKNKCLWLFHVNPCSLNKTFDDLQHLFSYTKNNLDRIAVTETRMTKRESLLNNLDLNNYLHEFIPFKTSAGDTLLYIANHASKKCGNDLNIYKKHKLESTFIEIFNPKKAIITVGVIFRYLFMGLSRLNSSYLTNY